LIHLGLIGAPVCEDSPVAHHRRACTVLRFVIRHNILRLILFCLTIRGYKGTWLGCLIRLQPYLCAPWQPSCYDFCES
jgi:hypothetical protein